MIFIYQSFSNNLFSLSPSLSLLFLTLSHTSLSLYSLHCISFQWCTSSYIFLSPLLIHYVSHSLPVSHLPIFCLSSHKHTHTHTRTHTHTHTNTHTHTHTQTHTFTLTQVLLLIRFWYPYLYIPAAFIYSIAHFFAQQFFIDHQLSILFVKAKQILFGSI